MLTPWRERVKFGLEWGITACTACVTVPVVGALGVAVMATSKGGPLYSSQRLGRGGRVFDCLKLRTMVVDAPVLISDDDKTVVTSSDSRVTPLGRILRTGLDEMPQLLTVLRGDMGLIGPRPDTDWMLPRYTENIRRRLAIRPGITGLSQVMDGAQSLTTAQNYALDVWYIDNHSFRLDAWIAATTAFYMMGCKSVGRGMQERMERRGVLDAEDFRPLPSDSAASIADTAANSLS